MKDYTKGRRLSKGQHTTTRTSLILLLLLTTMMMATVVTTTAQTTQSTVQQNANNGSPTREGAPLLPTATYWAKTYGGTYDDWAYSVQQTSDGGYIVAGSTASFGVGGQDFWVLKLNYTGGVTWQKTYGGTGNDVARSVQQTSDGGYIVAGYSNSFGAGGYDFWVLKLGSTGGVTWQKSYGGNGTDEASSIQQTSDGGYIVAGNTTSFGAGGRDFWVLKLNSTGGVAWQKTYGGSLDDFAWSIQQTADGGYIVAGQTWSFGAGGGHWGNAWVLKLNSAGAVTWQKTYGGNIGNDCAASVQQTPDGGYIVGGGTNSYTLGYADFWVLKLDSMGGVTWQKSYGGWHSDAAFSIQQTFDGGYVVVGRTNTFGVGGFDFWVLRLNSTGGVAWQNTYGGSGNDWAYSVEQTADGGYIVAGYTDSFGAGGKDVWVVKLGVDGNIVWDAGSDATNQPTGAVPLDSSATITATPVTSANSAATAANTGATPHNTSATVKAQSSPPPTPTIDRPGKITYTIGQTGFSITWHPSSQKPSKYYITRNETIVAFGTWSGTPITRSVDGLSVGRYIYMCTVNDTLGNAASSIVQVLVLPPAPTIDQPATVTYTIGQTGNSITWHPSSEIPDYYTISVNGSSPTSHSWNGSAITYNVDGLSTGTYSVNCTVYDTQGRSVSSTVTVTVSAPAGQGIPVILIVGAAAVVAIVVVISIVIIKKRKT